MTSTETTRFYFAVLLGLVLIGSMKWDKTEPKPIPFGTDPRQVQIASPLPD